MNKVQFFFMMVVTPIFAAYTAVFTMVAIDSWASKEDKGLDVPILGNVVEEEQEKQEKQNEEVESQEQLPNEEKSQTERTEETEKVENTEKSETKPSATNYVPKTTQKTTTKKAETKKTTTKTTTKQETKPATKSPKEICESRTDGPTTFIKVHFLSYIEKLPLIEFLNMEDPAVDYYKYVVKDGKNAKMTYVNNSCIPSKSDLVLVEDKTLESSELSTYHITAKSDYESWL